MNHIAVSAPLALLLVLHWIGGLQWIGGRAAAAGERTDTVRAEVLPHEPFVDARGVGVDALGAVYVADAGRDVVVKLDLEGHHVATIGGPGSREGEFDDPAAVDPTNGLVVYVADTGNHRIQLFTKSYAYLGSIPLVRSMDESSGGATYRRQDDEGSRLATGLPVAVATSGAGEVFAVDEDRRVVVKWNENRRLSAVIGDVNAGRGALFEPVDLWVGPGSLLLAADRGARAVLAYDQFGTFVRAYGGGSLENLAAVSAADDTIYAALPSALVLFELGGRLVRRYEIDVPEPIVDMVALGGGRLLLLTPRRLYRVQVER